jgi:hypothetical protein
MAFLERLGARPWHEDFYDLKNTNSFRISRWKNPHDDSVGFSELRARALGSPVPDDQQEKSVEKELREPPSYLKGHCKPATRNGLSKLVEKSEWCVRRREEFKVFNIEYKNCTQFFVQLSVPESETECNPPMVSVTSEDARYQFPVFDIRHVQASGYLGEVTEPILQSPETCPVCARQLFRVCVGFGIHSESDNADDTTWFALAIRCVHCSWAGVIFEHEGK